MKFLTLSTLYLILLISASCSKGGSRSDDGSQAKIAANAEFFKLVGKVYPYRTNNSESQKSILTKCIYITESNESCTVNELAPLGVSHDYVSTEDILSRTLVSHDFLGAHFEKALNSLQNPYLRKLFGSVTAVVISDKINPSFYTSRTGVIYISGRYLWLNEAQKKIVTQVTDTRGANLSTTNSSKLKFEFTSRAHIKGTNIRYPVKGLDRNLDDILPNLFRLLVHELTHANDYLPSSYYRDLSGTEDDRIGEILFERYKNYKMVSDQITSLTFSEILTNYAKAFYQNLDISPDLIKMDAYEMAENFEKSNACDQYAFHSTREDLAMLVEELISLSEMGIENSRAIISYPENDFMIPNDYQYPISWGVTNRILKPDVFKRAMEGSEKIFENFESFDIALKLKDIKMIEATPGISLTEFFNHHP